MLFITAASFVAALFQVVLAQNMQINTLTSPTQCEPVQFTWSGGAPPYYLALVPGGQPSAQAIKQFPQQNGDSMTWTVDLPAGTSFTTELRDSTGAQAFSDIQTVQSGPDSGCLGGSSSMSGTMSSTAMASSASSTMSSAASTNAATTPSGSGTSRGTSTTSSMSGSSDSTAVSGTGIHAATSGATASSTGSSNAASTPASAGAVGLAGVLGLIGAAFLG